MAKQASENEEQFAERLEKDLRQELGEDAVHEDTFLDLVEKVSYKLAELEDEHTPALGAEAEELRHGIEDVLSGTNAPTTEEGEYFHRALRELLDDVDARDSLKWLEERDKMVALLARAADHLESGGRLLASYAVSKEICDAAKKFGKKKPCPPKSTSRSKSTAKTRRS
jgi:hypothetical protein